MFKHTKQVKFTYYSCWTFDSYIAVSHTNVIRYNPTACTDFNSNTKFEPSTVAIWYTHFDKNKFWRNAVIFVLRLVEISEN